MTPTPSQRLRAISRTSLYQLAAARPLRHATLNHQESAVLTHLIAPLLLLVSGGNGGEETPRLSELFAVGPTPKPCAVCGFGSSLSFVHVLSSDGLRAGRTAVGMRYEQQEIDRYSDSELLAFAGQSVAAHSYDRRMALRLGAYYGVTDTLAIGLDLPWVNNVGLREAQDSPSPDIEDNGNQTGLGDASLTAQWTFHRDEAAGRSASLYVGAKLPTGRTHETTPGGERLEPDHQLGSGSTNPLLGLAGNQQVGQAVLGASAIYELATDGTLDSNLGDILRINLGVGWSPQQVQGNSLRWTFLLEALGEWRDRAELDGATDENTGGTQLFVAPGFRATWNEDVSCYGSVSFALVEDLNGEQADTDVRFATGFAVVF